MYVCLYVCMYVLTEIFQRLVAFKKAGLRTKKMRKNNLQVHVVDSNCRAAVVTTQAIITWLKVRSTHRIKIVEQHEASAKRSVLKIHPN